jgi:hypothetical protein
MDTTFFVRTNFCIQFMLLAQYSLIGAKILSRFRGDYTRGMDKWMDLLTTYTHHPQLQLITALPLISKLYQSQHSNKSSPPCNIINSRSLAMTSNGGGFSSSHAQVLLLQPPMQNSCQLNLQHHLFSGSHAELNYRLIGSPQFSFL